MHFFLLQHILNVNNETASIRCKSAPSIGLRTKQQSRFTNVAECTQIKDDITLSSSFNPLGQSR